MYTGNAHESVYCIGHTVKSAPINGYLRIHITLLYTNFHGIVIIMNIDIQP